MKIRLAITALIGFSITALGDLQHIIPESAEAVIREIPKAMDPISGEVIRVELEEGYNYARNLVIYARTRGIQDNNWGFNTEAHIGMFWQYSLLSTVLFADETYVVELVRFPSDESGRTQIESRQELQNQLSQHQSQILAEWQGTSKESVFRQAETSYLRSRFLGISVIRRDGREVLQKNDNDTIRALTREFGLGGTLWVIVHDLASVNNPLSVSRVVSEGDIVVKWKPSGNTEQRLKESTQNRAVVPIAEPVFPNFKSASGLPLPPSILP
jgi:hypothetical protein